MGNADIPRRGVLPEHVQVGQRFKRNGAEGNEELSCAIPVQCFAVEGPRDKHSLLQDVVAYCNAAAKQLTTGPTKQRGAK